MNPNDLTVILLVLAATWAGMFHVIKIVEIKNAKRDLILDISRDGKHLDRKQRELLLTHDYIPIWLGVLFFLVIYCGAFVALPFVLVSRTEPPDKLHWLEWVGSFGAALFAAYAFVVDLCAGRSEVKKMREHIDRHYPETGNISPVNTAPAASRVDTAHSPE